MTASLTLPAKLDLTAARSLAADLEARTGQALVLEASEVETLGGLCLQILLATAQGWRRAGHALTVSAPSDAFKAALDQFGLSIDELQHGATA